MIILCNLLQGLGHILGMVLSFFMIVIFLYAVLSWFSPDPNNFLVRLINDLVEPILQPLRSKIPPFGVLDMAAFAAFLGLMLLQYVVSDSLVQYGKICLAKSMPITVGIE